MAIDLFSKKTLIQFMMFGLVGLSNTLISYGIYVFLVYFGVHYLLASIAGFVVSVLNSFFWNNKFIFTQQTGEKRNIFLALLKTFLAYAATGLVLSNVLLIFFVEVLQLSKYSAPLASLIITIPLNFLLNKYWSFKNKKVSDEEN